MTKMNALAKIAAGLTIGLGLSACSMDTTDSSKIASTRNEQGQLTNNIDRRYSLTYSEAEGRSSFLGTFTMAGTWFTTVKLIAPANLVVNGRPIPERELISKENAVTAGVLLPVLSPFFFLASGTHYHANLGGGFGQTHTMQFTDQNGQVFNDQMKIYPAALSAPPTASRNADYVASMSGPAAPGESSYAVKIQQRDASGNLISAYGSTSYGSVIRISASEMSRLQPGPATVLAERSVRVKLNSVGSGSATGNSTYEVRPINITVY
jgi:hypothetical protein